MSEKYKIKTVKEFIHTGPAQFDIILRRTQGKVVNAVIQMHPDTKKELENAKDIAITLFPPENGQGIIQIVKRISDDVLFHQSDMVDADGIGSCFILEFKEDLIHCSVVCIFEQEPIIVEINQLTAHQTVDGEVEDEDYWPEPDNAIDEW